MDNVERRRLQLEENVSKLSKALEHWSAWETEYEMLKEELQSAGSPSSSDMLKIGRELGGTLVNGKEVEELLGKDLQTKRTANQVIDMISRRIDYVRQNRTTVEKKFDAAEKQLAGISVLSDPGLETEEGLPMMDIEEELDENDNVISSSVSQPGKVAPELMEALQKAGLHKAEQNQSYDDSAQHGESSIAVPPPATSKIATDPTLDPGLKSATKSTVAKNPNQAVTTSRLDTKDSSKTSKASPPKKAVSFADDVEVQTFKNPSSFKDDLKNWNLKPGQRVYELEDDDHIVGSAVVPDESPEDAQLRREMLQYGLAEVGQVVGELDLEEDMDEYEDEDYDSEDESEDEHGRTTRRVVTDDYRREMMELEQRLNARMMENVGPRPDVHPLAENVDDVRTLRVRKDEDFEEANPGDKDTAAEANNNNKSVRFANDFSVSEAPPPTISDTIVERGGPSVEPASATSKPGKMSRFKSARASQSQPPTMLPTPSIPETSPFPTGPEGRTLANTVVERTSQPSKPNAPDEFDATLVNREIQTEYNKLRNKMIQQQGGFAETEEEKNDPLMEDRDGKTKKVSRFKAARLEAEGL